MADDASSTPRKKGDKDLEAELLYKSMSTKALKESLTAKGIDVSDCLERDDLLRRGIETHGQEKAADAAVGADASEEKGQGEQVDYYKVIGVPRSASEQQIKSAYRRLALRYHPDKNQGNPEVAEKFAEISQAYTILSDPNKRRQYDAFGADAVANDCEPVDLADLGTGAKVFAAMLSKLGVPVPTAVPPTTLNLAQSGARETAMPLQLNGAMHETKIDKAGVAFYTVEVTEEIAAKGIRVNVTSAGDKFKLLWFDDRGHLMSMEESGRDWTAKSKSATAATMYMCSFQNMHLEDISKTVTSKMLEQEDDGMPITFRRLDTLLPSRYSPLKPASILFAVQGDNFFQKVKFKISAVCLDPSMAAGIMEIEETLGKKQMELAQFESEFWEAKQRFEAAVARITAEEAELGELLEARDKAYLKLARA